MTVIKVNLERAFFVLVILVLAGLLINCYFNNSGVSSEAVSGGSLKNLSAENSVNSTGSDSGSSVSKSVEKEESSAPKESCSDGIKNQDEIAVDCGGVCKDINGAYFYDGACHKEPEKKVTTSLSVDKVEFEGGITKSAKIDSVKVTISNGEDKNENFVLEFYVKNGADNLYLNQLDATVRGDPQMVKNALVAKDETKSFVFDCSSFKAPYIIQNDYYRPGDPFIIEVLMKNGEGEVVADAKSKVIRP